jgi:type IV pilus assembly protein PilX
MTIENETRLHKSRRARSRQTGAALVIGLVLLMVLTVLGVSGINMATLELNMAGNEQAQQLAFQAAETGIDVALSGRVDTAAPVRYDAIAVGDGAAQFDAELACVGTSRVPVGAFSENLAARAIHFEASSVGSHATRNATSRLTQSIYIVGPAPGAANFDPAASPSGC